jgi:TonB family protein
MREPVSDILADRAQVTLGMSRMVLLSLLAHGVLVTVMMFSPDWWRVTPKAEENAMFISLGGVEGPDTGGMTAPSAKRVDEAVTKPDPLARPVPPPAPKPEMTEAIATPKPVTKTPPKPVETAKPADTGRKVATGAEVNKGTAAAETGAKVPAPFGGISTGGGGFGGPQINVGNFCCPEYLKLMQQRIHANWQQKQGTAGRVIIAFTVQRDGRLTDVKVKQSGGQFLDLVSQRAIISTRQLPPLPREYTNPTLEVELILDYLR